MHWFNRIFFWKLRCIYVLYSKHCAICCAIQKVYININYRGQQTLVIKTKNIFLSYHLLPAMAPLFLYKHVFHATHSLRIVGSTTPEIEEAPEFLNMLYPNEEHKKIYVSGVWNRSANLAVLIKLLSEIMHSIVSQSVSQNYHAGVYDQFLIIFTLFTLISVFWAQLDRSNSSSL